jgi:hypothetical protein
MALVRNVFVSLAAVVGFGAIALASSTSCSPGFGTNPYANWDGAFPDVVLPDENVIPYAVCDGKDAIAYDETLMEAAPGLLDQGQNDIPLSPPKTYPGSKTPVSCVHLRVERDAQKNIVARRLVTLTPAKDFTKLVEGTFYELEKTPAGFTETLDGNADGFPEQISEMTYDGGGAWTGTVTTTYSGPDKQPVRRFTSAPKDLLTSSIREERWNGTTWDLTSDDVVTRDQGKCVGEADLPAPAPPKTGSKQPTCKVITCSPSQKKAIQDGMKGALRKVENCAPAAITSKPAAELASGALTPVCMTGSGCGYGETTSEGAATKDHPREVRVNVDSIGTDQFMPTIWHELVHIGLGERGTHPETKQKLAALLGKGLLVDRTYACEMMCFPPKDIQPTQCDCAACLDEVIGSDGKVQRATRCTPQCAGFADCTGGNTPDTGSYCQRQKIFCDTVAECEGACTTGASACGPRDKKTNLPKREGGNMSRACDPQCD